MKTTIYLAILFLAISCESNIDRPKSDKIDIKSKAEIPTFLLYGELFPDGYAEDRDSAITKNFGFKMKRVTGCEITNSLVDSVQKINRKNDEIMQSKYGKNWQEKFEKKSKLKLSIP